MFLDQFAARTHPAREYGSALYASNGHAKVDARAVRGVFASMVDISDNGDLLHIQARQGASQYVGRPSAALSKRPRSLTTLESLAELESSAYAFHRGK